MPRNPPTRCRRCRELREQNKRCSCMVWVGSRWHQHAEVDLYRWSKTRRAYLNAHPLCEVSRCHAIGDDVDHIIELDNGGDPYDWDNLQTLCKTHHSTKTSDYALAKRYGKIR